MIKIALCFAAIYALICIGVYFGNRVLMYFPDPSRVPPAEAGLAGVEEVELAADDGVKLIAWHAPAREGKKTILYLHGNASNAANRARKIEMMREDGSGVFYLNNRAYGGSGGRPSEANNVADAVAAYDHLVGRGVSPERIVAFGESLGSGQAVRLAAERPVAAMVLEAPLTSTIDVARPAYFWLPLGLLITDSYDNARNIGAVTAPVLILHGARDSVIPVEMGKRLFAGANEPKRLEVFPEGDHNDLLDHGAWDRARAFLASLR
jgi:pimeloyl-ACP methyl ester carboxylesterase